MPNIPEYDDQTKLKHEKEVAGIYVSGHPLANFAHALKECNFNGGMLQVEEKDEMDTDEEQETESKYEGLTDNMEVTCGGIITEMKKVYSKRDGSEMAILKIEDLYGSFDAMLFSKTFAMNKDKLLVDNIIKIKGKLSINDRGVCVRVENLSKIEDVTHTTEETKPEEKKAIPRLYLMYDLTDQELSKEIYSLLKSYPGESPVIVKCSKQKKPFQLGVTVNPKGFLINELHAFIEDDYIKVI
jgi:DNA polymerase-3 subunit alpha